MILVNTRKDDQTLSTEHASIEGAFQHVALIALDTRNSAWIEADCRTACRLPQGGTEADRVARVLHSSDAWQA